MATPKNKELKSFANYTMIFLVTISGIIWITCYVTIYRATQEKIEKQIKVVWEQAIINDYNQRLLEIGGRIIDKYGANRKSSPSPNVTIKDKNKTVVLNKKDLPVPSDLSDRRARAIQTLLVDTVPIRPNQLDSTFNSLLKEKNIYAKTAVSYLLDTAGNKTQLSVSDTSFCRKAFATDIKKTAIDNSIKLRGYVRITCITNMIYSKSYFFSWVLVGIGMAIMYYFVYKKFLINENFMGETEMTQLPPVIIKKAKDVFEPDEIPDEDPHKVIKFIYHSKNIEWNNITVELTPMEGALFYHLLKSKDYQATYESLFNGLWTDGNGDKARLEQQRCSLKKKLARIPVIELQTIRTWGYSLVISDGYSIRYKE